MSIFLGTPCTWNNKSAKGPYSFLLKRTIVISFASRFRRALRASKKMMVLERCCAGRSGRALRPLHPPQPHQDAQSRPRAARTTTVVLLLGSLQHVGKFVGSLLTMLVIFLSSPGTEATTTTCYNHNTTYSRKNNTCYKRFNTIPKAYQKNKDNQTGGSKNNKTTS